MRKPYTYEEKKAVIDEVTACLNVAEVSAAMNVPKCTIYNWLHELENSGFIFEKLHESYKLRAIKRRKS